AARTSGSVRPRCPGPPQWRSTGPALRPQRERGTREKSCPRSHRAASQAASCRPVPPKRRSRKSPTSRACLSSRSERTVLRDLPPGCAALLDACRADGDQSAQSMEGAMTQILANGIPLEYDAFGPETGEPLLLIMGLGAQMTRWPLGFIEELTRRGFRVIRFD